jgi:yersiniabactin nonribosomal peptide synthetase
MNLKESESQRFGPTELLAWLAARLGLAPRDLDAGANLLALGLDSIDIMAGLGRLRELGIEASLFDLYRDPTARGWIRLLEDAPRATRALSAARTGWPTSADGEPYALTPVQHAYLVGRSPQQALGGVGCHLYQEFDGAGLTACALMAALAQVRARHPMLRTAFRADGTQRRLAAPAWPAVAVHDLRHLDGAAQAAALLALRDRLSHRLMPIEVGHAVDFQLARLGERRHRLFTNVDLLVADAASYARILDEIAALLLGETLAETDSTYDFRSYLAQRAEITADSRERARRYWREKAPLLPPAPALPRAEPGADGAPVRITRRACTLSASQWRAFRQACGTQGYTSTMGLATCYAAVLACWTGQARVLLNLTLFDRHAIHPCVADMVADFTDIVLVGMEGEGDTLAAMAVRNQQAFAQAYEHHDYSGVEVLRDLRRAGKHAHGAPVVFTSNLGRPLISSRVARALGEPGWGVSQTPQVWIDNMALQREDEVILQWDCNDALFPAALTLSLFDAYTTLVRHLAAHPQAWSAALPELLPDAQRAVRQRVNATAAPLPERLLHADVFAQARRQPAGLALAHGDELYTHGQLASLARLIGAGLQARGVEAGERVGLCLPRGAGQIAAVLGTLYVGAIYVPIDVDQPEDRIERICRDAGLSMLIVCAQDPRHGRRGGTVKRVAWQATLQGSMAEGAANAPVAVPLDQAAYVIYTSGSTGTPKGVVVSHRSALNTVQDLNRRYRVSSTDRALALSALHFDLSVYDIFGVLGAGGALVLLDETQRRDPAVWCDRIARHGITLWNTVPALFDMLLTYAGGCGLDAPSHLRLVFLSGDWIARDLPARYRKYRCDGRFVAMGGATEAAIWSNAQDVADVPPAWPSIPYGFPLANQQYRVVDAAGRDCPDWVAGELWIGGAGVALGYHNDAGRTARQFVQTHTGRWYRSGDLGRYWPDGTLEFLGRRDKQVKIGGYRIELGEIDAAFNRIEGVCAAVTLALGEKEKSLASFVVLRPGAFEREHVADPLLPASYAASLSLPLGGALPARQAECPAHAAALAVFLLTHLAQRRVDLGAGLSAACANRRYGCIETMAPVLDGWLAWLHARGELTRSEGIYRLRDGAGNQRPEPDPVLACELLAHHDAVEQILRGQRPATTLLAHPFWSPEAVAMRMPGASAGLDYLRDALGSLARGLRRAPRLIEIGARSGLAASLLLRQLNDVPVSYLALDLSPDMVMRARERLAGHALARAEPWSAAVLAGHAHGADVVWANNSLHRHHDSGQALRDMLGLAAPGALLFIQEASELVPESLVSTELLRSQQAFPTMLRAPLDWQALCRSHGADAQFLLADAPMAALALRAPEVLRLPDEPALRAALHRQVPEYMVPRRIQFLSALPLTANGKVDAKALAGYCPGAVQAVAASEAPIGAAEHCLAALWREMLGNSTIDRNSDFFKLGGDSLLATRLVGMLAAQGYEVALADLFAYPRLSACAAALRLTVAAGKEAPMASDHAARHAPFPLTDLQQAYLVGRQPGFALGGIGSHFFVQFEVVDLDLARLQQAWDGMIARHDMLRAVVVAGGQRVLPRTPPFVIQRHRMPSLEGEQLARLRDRLSHEVRDPACWPSFAVHVVQDGGPLSQVLISLDNLFLDGMSMQMLFAEMKARYRNPDAPWPGVTAAFRDYVVGQLARQAAPQAWEYWRARLASLPAAPLLPLRCDPQSVHRPRFVRLEDHLPASAWRALRDTVADRGLTPSSLLLAAYAAVISAWSAAPAITLTLTLFDRRPVHPEIEQVMGDFTTLQLLAWHPHDSWLASALAMQDRMRQDLSHREVSAIRVLRELARQRKVAAVSMPVVFTSALGYERDEGFLSRQSWLKPVWGISQTPQTWLDLQVYEADGALYFNWDAVEALFEPHTLQAMFGQFAELLRTLARDSRAVLQDLNGLVPRHAPAAMPAARVLPSAAPASEDVPGPAAAAADTQAGGADLARVLSATAQVIGQDIGPDQNFFDAGATSLNLVQLHALLRERGCHELAVTDIFAYPSAWALAGFLGGRASATGTVADATHGRPAVREARRNRRLRREGSP